MSAIDRLIENYDRQVSLPWPPNLAGKQKVWFAVYPAQEERRLRAHVKEFEAATLKARYAWKEVDLTRVLPEWLGAHEYSEAIFREPEQFTAGTQIEECAIEHLRAACLAEDVDAKTVVAVCGLGSLFDLVSVARLMDALENDIRGRLLVFFPGEYRHNTYRFMDARDGFNYMAIPITTSEGFMKP